ncbi:CsgG/HfaB family protein [Calditerrivibrio nitroreducens]|uniref:CsgG/HfaB family protein n=1 Tax=Calditerrivibrio nitroreducens TaxID=477976 RepID=UPI001C0A8B0C|nr:CsgG/HfaB family protein [Calditerrivibrio nitroreducens]
MALCLVGTTAFSEETKVEEIKVPVPHCSEPVLSVAINDIECTAASCQDTGSPSAGFAALAQLFSGAGGVKGIGNGVKSMLTNALQETKCFKIIDLAKFQQMKKMLEATGQTVTPPKIDLFISGQITSVSVGKSGGALGGGFIPILGLISKSTETADITFDLMTMNPTTLEQGESKSFKANSEQTSWGFGAVGAGVGGGWSISKSLALDSVVRDVVFSATNYLAETFAKDKIIDRPAQKTAKSDSKNQE